jgi:hypothetical protein
MSRLKNILKYTLSVSSAVVLIAVLVVILISGIALTLPHVTQNTTQSDVTVPNVKSENVCFGAPKLDEDEGSALSNDEEFGATKAPTISNSLVTAVGKMDSNFFNGLSALVGPGSVVEPNKIGTETVSGIAIGTSSEAGTQIMKTNFSETDNINFASNGIKKNVTASGDLRGSAVAKCQRPDTDFWFLGGDTHVQATTKVVLTNPSDAPAQVMITVWGDNSELGRSDDGSLKYSANRYVGVNAKSEMTVNLSAGAANQKMIATHIQALTTPISAVIQTSSIKDINAQGIEYVNGQQLSKYSTIPGVNVTKNDGKNTSTLGLISPNSAKSSVKARFIPYEKSKQTVEKVYNLDDRSVELEDLGFLENGIYSIELEGQDEFLATVEQTVSDGALREIAFNSAAQKGSNQLVVLDDADYLSAFYSGKETKKYSLIAYNNAGSVVSATQVSFNPDETKTFTKESLNGATIVTMISPDQEDTGALSASVHWEHSDRFSVVTSTPIGKSASKFGFSFLG